MNNPWKLEFSIPEIPPSVNKIYTRTRSGGQAISKEGRRYVNVVREAMRPLMPEIAQLPDRVDTVFLLELNVRFPCLVNMSFITGKGKKKARDWLKDIDDDNRVKFARDCIFGTLAFCDKHVVETHVCKRQGGPAGVGIDVRLTTVDPQDYGIPALPEEKVHQPALQ